MPDALVPLAGLVQHLSDLVAPLSAEQLRSPAYPNEWTIADTLSHLGSGAVIGLRTVQDAVTGAAAPEGFNQSVWDEWDAKSPEDQAAESVRANQELLAALRAVDPQQAEAVSIPLGPMTLDWRGYVELRLNEQAMHTWDVDVALDPAATLPADATEIVVDNLEMVAGFTAKPDGPPRTVEVLTTDPARAFTIEIGADRATLSAGDARAQPDVTLPAEAFARLVFGRLDPGHTPTGAVDPQGELDSLRRVFPGL